MDEKKGRESVIEMFQVMDEEMRERLLTEMAVRDPALAAEIKNNLFRFEDIKKLSAKNVQDVLKSIRVEHLALAMKTASPELQAVIFGNLSSRAQENLKEEIAALGPRRVSDVQAAQQKIAEIASAYFNQVSTSE